MSDSWNYDESQLAEIIRQLLTAARIPEASRYEPISQIPDLIPGFAVWDDSPDLGELEARVAFAGDGPARDRIKQQAVKALEDLGWWVLNVDSMAFRTRPPEAVREASEDARQAEEHARHLSDQVYRAAGCKPPQPLSSTYEECPF